MKLEGQGGRDGTIFGLCTSPYPLDQNIHFYVNSFAFYHHRKWFIKKSKLKIVCHNLFLQMKLHLKFFFGVRVFFLGGGVFAANHGTPHNFRTPVPSGKEY